jgi:phosphoribosylformylglycinamidine synthase
MTAIKEAAEAGKYILGICNGFQILTESRLLPGALLRNKSLKFRCHAATLRVENVNNPFTKEYTVGEEINIPINHGEGNYYCDDTTLQQLKENNQIVFRYAGENPNGSLDDIAGICNKAGNVVGMMPHPERAANTLLGSEDGKRMFTSILSTWRDRHDVAIR